MKDLPAGAGNFFIQEQAPLETKRLSMIKQFKTQRLAHWPNLQQGGTIYSACLQANHVGKYVRYAKV